jgi:hypothetical protein
MVELISAAGTSFVPSQMSKTGQHSTWANLAHTHFERHWTMSDKICYQTV